MKQIIACSDRQGLVTTGTASPPSVAQFNGNSFYFNTSTRRLYTLVSGAVRRVNDAGAPPTTVDATSVTAVQIASGLANPWAVAQLPNGKYLVTEKLSGKIRIVNGASISDLGGVPATFVGTGDQHGGMLDLILDSQFSTNRTIYFTHVIGSQAANQLRLAKAVLAADDLSLSSVTTVHLVVPTAAGTSQYGGRIAEAPDGTIYIASGDRDGPHDANGNETAQMRTAQDWTVQTGKVLRVNKDGSTPADNPFAGSGTPAQRPVFARGFRNILGAAIGPDGALWVNENLASGGDEINRVQSGLNYGWPNQSYGSHYGGGAIPDTAAGVEPPVWYSAESIAPSGMLFIKGTAYGSGWTGNCVFGALADYSGNGGRRVSMLKPNAAGTGFSSQTALRTTLWGGGTTGPRCRDVRQGIDGKILVLTDDGRLMRLDPVFPSTPSGPISLLVPMSESLHVTDASFKRLYGPGRYRADHLFNCDLKRSGGTDFAVCQTFVAPKTGTITFHLAYYTATAGYAAGDGGDIRVRFFPLGANGEPNMAATPIASFVMSPRTHGMANGRYNNTDSQGFWKTSVSVPVTGAVGYGVVYDNIASDPVNNWCAMNNATSLQGNGRVSRWLAPLDMAVLVGTKAAGSSNAYSWANRTTNTYTNSSDNAPGYWAPIMQLTYSDGEVIGNPMMEFGNYNGPNIEYGRYDLSAGDAAREVFTLPAAMPICGFTWHLGCIAAGSIKFVAYNAAGAQVWTQTKSFTPDVTWKSIGSARYMTTSTKEIQFADPLTANSGQFIIAAEIQSGQFGFGVSRNGTTYGFTNPQPSNSMVKQGGSSFKNTNIWGHSGSGSTQENWAVTLHRT